MNSYHQSRVRTKQRTSNSMNVMTALICACIGVVLVFAALFVKNAASNFTDQLRGADSGAYSSTSN